MKEFVTESFILDARDDKENNRVLDVFTKDLGRIDAKTISSRKILSKLNPHLQILSFSLIRLINKNQFIVTDALNQNNLCAIKDNQGFFNEALELVFLLKNSLPKELPDANLWNALKKSFDLKTIDYSNFLSLLGYNPRLARCDGCGRRETLNYFQAQDHCFVCNDCNGKFPRNIMVKCETPVAFK